MTNTGENLIDEVEALLPENLSDDRIAALCGFIISQFAETEMQAAGITFILTRQLLEFYEYKRGEECECPKCTAERAEQVKH